MSSDTSARVAVVTGASRGIGAVLASAFAGAGYVVEGASRHGTAALAGGPPSGGGQVSGERAAVVAAIPAYPIAAVDVTDETAVHGFVAGVLDRHGRIDVLVNNAGLIDEEVPLEDSDPEQWWRTVEVNVRGPYLMTRMVLPRMLRAGRGCVINVNSGAGTRPGAVASAYNVSKTALARLTGSTHLSGLGRGVCAFDLMPGVVRTDMTTSMRAHVGRTEWTEPSVVAELALALASGELDAWSGRMMRAGVDTPASLKAASDRLGERTRQVVLEPYGPDDPLA